MGGAGWYGQGGGIIVSHRMVEEGGRVTFIPALPMTGASAGYARWSWLIIHSSWRHEAARRPIINLRALLWVCLSWWAEEVFEKVVALKGDCGIVRADGISLLRGDSAAVAGGHAPKPGIPGGTISSLSFKPATHK